MSVGRYLIGSEFQMTEKIDAESLISTKILRDSQDATIVFTNINGGKAVGNIFSTRKKIADALNIRPDEIVTTLIEAINHPCEPVFTNIPEFKTKQLELNLVNLPICKYFPKDGGRYISSGVVVSEYNGKRNISFHRMMIVNKDTIAIRLVPRDLYEMYEKASANNEELKISICIGARLEVLLAASTSVDYEIDEMTIASALCMKSSGKPILVGKTDNGLIVPSECDYVFEARITFDKIKEGPFVDISGTYDQIRQQPIVKVEKIWSKIDPYFHFILPGGNEHYLLMGLPREPVIFISVKEVVDVKCIRLTEGGCCWFNGVISIKKRNQDDGIEAAVAAIISHRSMKNVIVVDDDIDVFNDREIEWALTTRFQARKLIVLPGEKGSSLDPSANDGVTCKVIIDATIPMDRDKVRYVKATL
ncbi:MAG: UbiD family decarboxylase [archaeon]|nr:UbiD family decarboxylase [archaeon]